MENIREVFKNKSFDDTTLKLLDNFINEFDDLFGKYIPKDELIKRIQENLNGNIEFTEFESSKKLGQYNRKDKRILLKEGLSEEEKKSVFFHEMIHCITNQKEFIGFSRGLVADELLELNPELEIEQGTAMGLTEGFTQFVSRIREKKYGTPTGTYPILTEQTQNLAELVGVDEFLDVGFNRPKDLASLIIEKGVSENEFEIDMFLEKFDVIHKCEKQILMQKQLKKEPGTDLLLANLLGIKDPNRRKMDDAKAGIITTLLGKIARTPTTTGEDFATIYELIQKYSRQLQTNNNYDVYKVFFAKVGELEKEGKTREEIIELLPEEAKPMVETNFKFRDFTELEPSQMLKRMAENPDDIYTNILSDRFENAYSVAIAKKIFKGISDDDLAYKLTLHLADNLSKKILERGWNTDLLSIEVINLDYPSGLTFNLYEANGEDIKYLSTFTDANELCQIEEMRVCTATEKLKLLDENPELDANSILMKSPSGGILAYNGKSDYIYIGDDKKVTRNYGDIEVFMSRAEIVQRSLRTSAERFEQMSQLNAPATILRDIGSKVRELEKEHNGFVRERKFTPADIERAAKEVTLEDVEKILSEIIEPKTTREEVFEKGIGYNE